MLCHLVRKGSSACAVFTLIVLTSLSHGCSSEKNDFLYRLLSAEKVVFVGAHPDDEITVATFFLKYRPSCSIILLTRGEGGLCYLPEGCPADLGSLRAEEARRSASLLGCELQMGFFPNAPTSFVSIEERLTDWEGRGARQWLRDALRAGDAVISFDPDTGFTLHTEHRAASKLALEVAREVKTEGFYHVLNPARAMPLYSHEDVFSVDVEDVYPELIILWNTAYPSQHDPFLSAAVASEDVWKRIFFRLVW